MLLGLFGATSNLIGFVSCMMVAFYAFKLARLGTRRAFYLSIGSLIIGIALMIYGISFSFSLLVSNLFVRRPPLLLRLWLLSSLLMLIGYLLLAVSYTVHSFRNPFALSLLVIPSIMRIATLEIISTVLVLYLLLLIAYNTGKRGGRVSPLTVLSFFLLFTSQLVISLGLFRAFKYFLLGVAMRGVSFLPLLLVALESRK